MKRIFTFWLLVGVVFWLGILGNEEAARAGRKQKSGLWTFQDGVGNPISNAKCEVFKCELGASEGSRFASLVLDEQGQCKRLYVSGTKFTYYIVLEHPHYGEHIIRIPTERDKEVFSIPAVPKETEAYARSIRGYLLDDANNPIDWTMIRVKGIYPPGGQTVYAGGVIRTDESGWFHIYPFIASDSRSKIGKLVPPNSCYLVRIEPPVELGLAPAMMCISNDGEQVVRMKERGYFHTISFEDTDGRITDRKRLGRFELNITKAGMRSIRFEYGHFKSGCLFPLGTYRINDTELDYEFEQMEVTTDSQVELVFKTKHDISRVAYIGEVVHGITGEPIEGAFVMAMSSMNIMYLKNLSELTPKQWEVLHALSLTRSSDEPGLKSLRDTFTSTRIVRTNSSGKFRLLSERKQRINTFVVFAKDYLGVKQYTQGLEIDENGRVQIPAIPLFPAATVVVDVRIGLKGPGYPGVQPLWLFEPNSLPEWARKPERDILYEASVQSGANLDTKVLFSEPVEDANRVTSFWEVHRGLMRRFTYNEVVLPNRVHRFYVPAGLELYMTLHVQQDRKNEWTPIGIPKAVNLEQGQVVDLGRCEIRRSIPVVVRVVDSARRSLEGIPVDHPIEEWKGPKSTDRYGRVRFNVHLYSEGEFSIQCRYHNVRECIRYKVGGQEDAGREFVFVISDDLLSHFVKE